MAEKVLQAARYLERPPDRVRRKDRSLVEDEWIDRMLETTAVGHVAVCWQGEPLLHSNIYWFDGQRIYWHTAAVGRFRAVLDQGPTRACFTVTEQGRILPAGTPLDFSTEYASILLYGTARVVADPAEKLRGLEGLMAKYAPHLQPGVDYVPMPDGDVAQTSLFCLDVETRVGKHNVKPPDYPAYEYSGGSFIQAERDAGRYTVKPKELS
jgi:nitroimidazol reductase NimA-like FMN-containing flavoprotein (pyridoxamine 5'-phosphate oxidase superfamily)